MRSSPVGLVNRPAQAVAWFAVLGLASGLPTVLAQEMGLANAVLVQPAVVALLLLGWAGARRKAATGELAGLLLVLAASTAGVWAMNLLLSVPAVESWQASAPVAVWILVVNGLKIIPVALMILVIVRYRLDRDALYLRPGILRAPSGIRIGGYRPEWTVIGQVVALILLAGIGSLAVGQIAPGGLSAALTWLPVYALAAVLNSGFEEFQYRHALFAFLRPLMGTAPMVTLTSLQFGVAHIHGNPSGLPGIALSAVFGLVLAMAIIQAKGFRWNWPLHFCADLAIFFVIVATAASS